jgi:FkbM family methyltransferase
LLRHLDIDLVLDVGANEGQYARTHLRDWTGYRGRIASFEPVKACYAACASGARNDAAWATFAYGLSDTEVTRDITVPNGQTDLSSLHHPTTTGKRMIDAGSQTEPVLLRRLDDAISEVARPADRLALKIDSQGHEAAVLRGATDTLPRVALVECEVPLVRMYEGQETLAELLAILAAAGFSPVGIESNYVDPETGFAMDADAFFVRGAEA